MNATLLVGIGLALAIALALHDILLVVFGGILVGILLRAMTEVVMRYTKLSSPFALTTAISLIVLLIGAALWYGGALLVGQVAAFQSALAATFARILTQAQSAPWGPIFGGIFPVGNVLGSVAGFMQRATSLLSSAVGGVIAGLVMTFIGICIAAEPSLYINGCLAVFPKPLQRRLRRVMTEAGATLRAWLVARLVSMAIIAILVTAGLTALRIPFSVVLGGLAGLLTFIPNIGAIVAAIPSLAFALAIGPEQAAFVVLMYWAAHFLDDFIVNPIAERRIVHLPPALTITVQLALGTFVGILGIALAAPITAATIVFVRRFWVDKLAEGGDQIASRAATAEVVIEPPR